MDLKDLPHNAFDTGEVCPTCGEHIYAARIIIGGKSVVYKKPCSCQNQIILEENAEKAARDKAMQIEINRRICYESAQVPESFAEVTLSGYRRISGTEEAFEAVKSYLLNRKENFHVGKGLLLSGPCGTGKTHLGCAILNCALNDGYRAIYKNVPEMLDLLQPDHAEGEEQGELMKTTCRAGVLLLDDLGAEKPSEWTQKQLTIIIDARYRGNRPTIITTNLAGKSLADSCGARVYSRLMDESKTAVVTLTAEDYRRKKA
jgi:DNA replication protein DnaC